METLNVLAVCIGNGDHSPLIKAWLEHFFKSACAHEVACNGEGAPPLAVSAARTFGLDLSDHVRTFVGDLGDLEK